MFYATCRNVCFVLFVVLRLSATAFAGFFDKAFPCLRGNNPVYLWKGFNYQSIAFFIYKLECDLPVEVNRKILYRSISEPKAKRNILITKFKYQLCDGRSYSRNPAWVRDVDVMTTAYGDLDVLGTLVTAVNLTAPVKASVSLRRKILGLYVPIPCIKEFGSCDYPDLCVYGFSENEECPPIFDEHDIPCRCPIRPGVYTLPGGQFQVPKTRWARLLAGQYKGLVKFYERNKLLACYKFYYTLE